MTRAHDLLRQALDALEIYFDDYPCDIDRLDREGYAAITAIREYLAQPEQEPVKINLLEVQLAAVTNERDELQEKLRYEKMNTETWRRDAEGKLEDRTAAYHELAASQHYAQGLLRGVPPLYPQEQDGVEIVVTHPNGGMSNDEFNQLADGSWKYEIESLRARVAALEDELASALEDLDREVRVGNDYMAREQLLRNAIAQAHIVGGQAMIDAALSLPHDTSALDALVKDAARYRWLRSDSAYLPLRGADLDAAIDEAMR
jgi:hypothetical protein